eukprot:8701951-Alexandrium_andersonii.AAC.1
MNAAQCRALCRLQVRTVIAARGAEAVGCRPVCRSRTVRAWGPGRRCMGASGRARRQCKQSSFLASMSRRQ